MRVQAAFAVVLHLRFQLESSAVAEARDREGANADFKAKGYKRIVAFGRLRHRLMSPFRGSPYRPGSCRCALPQTRQATEAAPRFHKSSDPALTRPAGSSFRHNELNRRPQRWLH